MIPGAHTVHSREAWQDPRYPVFGPFDNPGDNDTIVIHYTAADDLIDGDPGEHADNLPAYMRAMQRSYVTNDQWYRVGETWWHTGMAASLPGDADLTARPHG